MPALTRMIGNAWRALTGRATRRRAQRHPAAPPPNTTRRVNTASQPIEEEPPTYPEDPPIYPNITINSLRDAKYSGNLRGVTAAWKTKLRTLGPIGSRTAKSNTVNYGALEHRLETLPPKNMNRVANEIRNRMIRRLRIQNPNTRNTRRPRRSP